MSKLPNNLSTKELEALLAKKNSHNNDLDDFEKEALDGFAVLDNDEDAIALKEKLDTRIHSEVFSKEKKATPLYWLAAAGLLLVIGLSVFFMVNNQALETKKSDLAIASPKIASQEEIPNVINQEQSSAATIELKKSNSTTNLNDDKKPTASLAAREKAADLGLANKQQPITAAAYDMENEVEERKEVMTTPPVQTTSSVLADEMLANKDSDQGQNDGVGNNNDKKLAEGTTAASGAVTKNESKRQKQAAPEIASSVGANEPFKNKESLAIANTNCFYIGGEAALTKEVKQKLAIMKITAPFSARLFITKKAKVEKVEFIDNTAVTADEQKLITAALNSLKDFRIIKWPKNTTLIEYSFVFKP
jgi:hypothetical protein